MNHDRRDSLRSSLLRRDFPESLRMCVCHAYTRTLITRAYFTIPYGATDAYIPARLQTRPARHLRGNLRRNDCESLHGRKRDDTNINAVDGRILCFEEVLSQSSRSSKRTSTLSLSSNRKR